MPGKLSEKFQELKTSAGNNGKIRANNQQKRAATQQQHRGNKFNQKRGLAVANSKTTTFKPQNRPNSGRVNARAGKVRVNRRQLNNNPNQNGSNRKPKGRKPGSANGKRPVKKAPVTGADLDKDLDTYWFSVGKGPNPEVASLDREMDDYFKNKKSTDGVDAAQNA